MLIKIIFISKFFVNETLKKKKLNKLLKNLIRLIKFEFLKLVLKSAPIIFGVFSSYNHFADLAVFKAFSAVFVFLD